MTGESEQPGELVQLPTAAAGVDIALEELELVYAYVYSRVGNRPDAEDVTQDVFVACWERPAAFDPERGRLRTFLGTLAHRRRSGYPAWQGGALQAGQGAADPAVACNFSWVLVLR